MTIRKPRFQLLTAEYEIYADEDAENPVGKAVVEDGVITKLAIDEHADKLFKGQVLSTMLMNITQESDRTNSNLSIKIAGNHTQRLKRFLERFGFRDSGDFIFKRIAGSARPPGVLF